MFLMPDIELFVVKQRIKCGGCGRLHGCRAGEGRFLRPGLASFIFFVEFFFSKAGYEGTHTSGKVFRFGNCRLYLLYVFSRHGSAQDAPFKMIRVSEQ